MSTLNIGELLATCESAAAAAVKVIRQVQSARSGTGGEGVLGTTLKDADDPKSALTVAGMSYVSCILISELLFRLFKPQIGSVCPPIPWLGGFSPSGASTLETVIPHESFHATDQTHQLVVWQIRLRKML